MKITNREQQYNINLSSGESIDISINGTGVYSESVGNNKEAQVTYMFQEYITGTQ